MQNLSAVINWEESLNFLVESMIHGVLVSEVVNFGRGEVYVYLEKADETIHNVDFMPGENIVKENRVLA